MQHSAIGPVVKLDREESEKFAAWFAQLADHSHSPSQIEIAVNQDGMRIKFDGGVWTPPLGEQVAQ